MSRCKFRTLLCGLFILAQTSIFAADCKNVVSGLDAPRKPQNTSQIIVGKDYDEIIEQGFISIGVYDNFAPYSWNDDGTPKGIDVEIAKLIGEKLGVEARITLMTAGENIDTDFRSYIWQGGIMGDPVVNVMLRAPFDKELSCRIDQVHLFGAYSKEKVVIAYREEDYDDPPTPAYFRYDKVGVLNDSIADFFLGSQFGGSLQKNIVHFPTIESGVKAMEAGKVKAFMGPLTEIKYFVTEPSIKFNMKRIPNFALSSWPLGAAVRTNYRQLGYAVGDILKEAVNQGVIANFYEQYNVPYIPPDQ